MDISASEEEDEDGKGRLTKPDAGLATNFPPKPKDATSAKALAYQGAKGAGPDATDYESDIARAQIYAMAAGDAQSLADDDPRYVQMMDNLRYVLCVLSDSEEAVQRLDSRILCQPDRQILTDFGSSPAERQRVEQRLTREVTKRMLFLQNVIVR
eukprot:3384056-Pleurochrysis_carterae.AAC.1